MVVVVGVVVVVVGVAVDAGALMVSVRVGAVTVSVCGGAVTVSLTVVVRSGVVVAVFDVCEAEAALACCCCFVVVDDVTDRSDVDVVAEADRDASVPAAARGVVVALPIVAVAAAPLRGVGALRVEVYDCVTLMAALCQVPDPHPAIATALAAMISACLTAAMVVEEICSRVSDVMFQRRPDRSRLVNEWPISSFGSVLGCEGQDHHGEPGEPGGPRSSARVEFRPGAQTGFSSP